MGLGGNRVFASGEADPVGVGSPEAQNAEISSAIAPRVSVPRVIPSPSPRSPTAKPELSRAHYVNMSDREFHAWWWFILLYHFLTVVFTLIAGTAHVFLGDINVYENMWLLAIPRELLVVTGWSYLVVSAAHILAIMACVARSIYHRRLTFGYEVKESQAGTLQPPPLRRMSVFRPQEVKQRFRFVVARFLRGSVFSVMAVSGKYFEDGLHAKQLVEVVLQTYQARTLSRSVPNRRLNRLVVGLVVTNCIYTPIIDFMFRKETGRRRLVSLIVDVVVDFAVAVVVPIWVLIPMLRQFDWVVGRFPSNLTYNDVWVANSISDGRQALVTSLTDYVSSLLPHVLGLVSMDIVKSMLRRRQYCYSAGTGFSSQISERHLALAPAPEIELTAKTGTGPGGHQRSQTLLQALIPRVPKGTRVSYVVDRALVVWALMVLILHLGAEGRLDSTHEGCAVHANAWLPAGYPCSVFQVNCYRVGSTGASDEMTVLLKRLDPVALSKLIFSHCSALEIPSIITIFSSMRSIETFNSTIARWDESAAVTESKMPSLVQVQLVLTNFSTAEQLPTGFFHANTPIGLNVVIHGSNLSTLPDDIGRVWGTHRWGALWFEMTQLKSLPVSFGEIKVTKISLLGGQIERLDDDIFKTHSPAWLRVSDNPLRAFPRNFYDIKSMSQLFAERTHVTELSPWLEQWWASGPKKTVHGDPILLLRGSAFCDGNQESIGSSKAVFCTDIDPRVRDDVRLDLLREQRPL